MAIAVIITYLPVEYLAVRSHLSDLREEVHPQGTIYERGKFAANGQEWEVGIVETGAGNARSAIVVERAIAYFNPDIILFVGIAGGIKDVEIGDVVAATKVYGYESGKVGEQFFTRPAMGQSAYALMQRAKSEARKEEWLQRLTSNLTTQPRVFIAPIAAGEKVVASRELELFQFLSASYNDAVAVEMEGFAFLSVGFAYPNIKSIIIRGISDLINRESKIAGDSHEIAALHASAFAFQILANLPIKLEESFIADAESFKNKSKAHQPTSPNFFAYDDAWVGRDNLIQELSDRVRASCRLLVLLGITGIGKTALGERIAVDLADWFDADWSNFHQENFDDEQQSSDFASVAARWLEKWGELITPDDRKDPQRLLYRLIAYLKDNRRLIQMDSLENILEANEEENWNRFKDEWWIKFFESYLKADSCQSCIILTSQDLPGQLEDVGKRSQNFWYCQALSGLNKLEQIELFNKTGLDVSEASDGKTYLERICNAYEGHPLALRVIAGEIKNKPFEGNVVAYWHKYGNKVEEVEKAISQAQEGISVGADDKWQLDRYTKTLRRNVRSRLNKTFARLKEDSKWAYILLCEASVYHGSVPEKFWLSHLEDWDRNELEQKAALDTLRDRNLVEEFIEKDQVILRQHNLVRSISLEHLSHMDESNSKNSLNRDQE